MSGELERAEALAAQGRHAEALALLAAFTNERSVRPDSTNERSFGNDPTDERSVSRAAAVLAARSLRALGRPRDALAQADRAVAAAPEDPDGHVERASSLAVLGRYAAAEDAAREALSRDPYSVRALLVAAEASLGAERGERALAYGELARGLAPDDPTALRAHGIGLHACRRWADAEGAWRGVLLHEPGDRQALDLLGAALRGQGRADQARMLAEAHLGDGMPDPAAAEAVATAYRSRREWPAIAGVILAAGLFLGLGSAMGPAGTVLLVLFGAGYAVLRSSRRSRVPATAVGRAVVEHLDRRADRAAAGFAGAFAVATGLAWFTRSPSGPPGWVAGTVLCLGGLAGVGIWWRAREPGEPS